MNDPRFDPLPADSTKHVARFVRDLAWGTLNNKWRNGFYIQGIPAWRELKFAANQHPDLKLYLAEVWNNAPPDPVQLEDLGYIVEIPGGSIGDNTASYKLTEKGLHLGQGVPQGPIFISYRRIESSAFALLVSDRLKANGLAPFLDNQTDEDDQGVALKPGGQWRPDLKEAIEARNYLVSLIAPSTLSSPVVCQELTWALEANKRIIPIWHRGFDPNNKEHLPDSLPAPIRAVITDMNAIRVVAEDPQQYEVAIKQRLSVFRTTF